MKIDASHMPPGFAVLWVRPVHDLATTSAFLGRALGGLTFEPTAPGMFDEFPAQVAYSGDMRFALLAPPEDEDLEVGYSCTSSHWPTSTTNPVRTSQTR